MTPNFLQVSENEFINLDLAERVVFHKQDVVNDLVATFYMPIYDRNSNNVIRVYRKDAELVSAWFDQYRSR